MLELLVLGDILDNYDKYEDGILVANSIGYDGNKIEERYEQLLGEFLEPYVTDNAPNGE